MANATVVALYTANGSYTWVAPTGVSSANTECWGAGGGASYPGGGGGEYAAEASNTVTAGNSYTVTVGIAGTAGTSSADGGAGGSSSFSGTGATTVTANGGHGGQHSTPFNGGTGGTGSTNTAHHNGGAGGSGSTSQGGGGGSGGTTVAGAAGIANDTTNNKGGAKAVLKGGPGGNVNTAGAGHAPVKGPGGGGGGGNAGTGGAGSDGQVKITYTVASGVTVSNGSGAAYVWTAPTATTYVTWTISGTAAFDGFTSSGSEVVAAGTTYAFSVGNSSSITITWSQAAPSAFVTALFDTSGSKTWVAPGGVNSAKVECYGGGAGGDSTTGSAGGGGEYAAEPANTVTPGNSYTVSVGAGGSTATAGSNSSFSGTGATTVTAHGGGASTTSGIGGAGGTGSTNTNHYDGGTGGVFGSGTQSGGGGGSGSSGGAGGDGETTATGNGNAGSGGDGSGGGGGGGDLGSGAGGAGGTGSVGGGGGGGGKDSGSVGTGGSGPLGNGANGSGSAGGAGGGPGGGAGGAGSGSNTGGGGGGSLGGGGSTGNDSGSASHGGAGGVLLTYLITSGVTQSAATTGGTYTWTPPSGITSVSWVITGTATFDGNSSSGNETVVPGTAYTFTIAAASSLTISWGAPTDIPVYLPGPTWLATFKPFIPRPRPPVVPSGPYYGNQPNYSDIPSIKPGTTWLGSFKPGLRKPRPVQPHANVINAMVSMSMAPMAMSGAGTETPGAFGSIGMSPMAMSGTVQVPVVVSGSVAMAPMAMSGVVHVPVVIQSGNLAMAPMTIVTPSFLSDQPSLNPGPTWLNRFKPWRGKTLKIPAARQHIGATGSMVMAPMTFSAASATVFLPFPRYILSIFAEILINGTWLDITQFVYQRNDIVITRGLPDETQATTPSSMTLTLDNRDGRFSPNNINGAYYPYLTRNTQLRVSIVNQASASGVTYSGYRFWGEMSAIPPSWDNTGTDVYVDATVSGPLRRYIQSAPMGSALRQYYSTLTGNFAPYAIWPCEDGSQATQFASLLQGVSAMTYTGAPQLSSNNAFGGSDALPVVSSSVWHGQTGAAANPPGTGSITQKNPGSYTWTAPPGVSAITSVLVTGAGGGGGDTNGTTGGSGGGGGGSRSAASLPVTAGNTYTYVVGAGGAAGSGAAGHAGADSSMMSDSPTILGKGGGGGGYAGAAAGAGGAGQSFTGGSGGTGSASATAVYSLAIYGTSGASGGGTNVRAGQNQNAWTAPTGVTGVSVTAVSGGGGGGAGGGNAGGGQGGGGGAYASGSIGVTPGNSYTFSAGNGGAGGSGGNPAPANTHGNPGGNSGVTGDSGSVLAGGADGGNAGGGDGGPGNVISGSGFHGGGGGGGTNSAFGGGGSGGGGASAGGLGTSGGPASGSHGGTNGVGGDGGTYPSPDNGKTGQGYGAGGGGGASSKAQNGLYGGNGGGGQGGYITWSWAQTGSPAGGGGGSSAGSAGGGNSGSSSGAGGSAPSGGGSGGTTGATPNGSAPGGGGAGAVPGTNASSSGSGAAGQVKFSWSGGTSSPVAGDVVRFCLDVNSAGAADGAVLVRALTYGTVAQMDLVYHTGGHLEMIGYNSSSAQIFDSGSISFTADGTPLYVSMELASSGSNVTWKLSAIKPGAGSVVATATGSVAGQCGYVSDVYVDPAGTVVDSGTCVGWITVQTYADTLVNMSPIVNGYAGELASVRIARLCAARNLGFELVGNDADTPLMGPQQDDTFLNVIQSCADLDRGQLFETRDQFGIGYRTRVSMQGQNPAVIAFYGQGMLAAQLRPTADDQYTRNNITVTRNGGASSTAALTSGPMSTMDPPNGVGVYTQSLTVQANNDAQLTNLVAWLLTIGTVAEYRFPQLSFDMARTEVEDLFGLIPGLDIGDFVQVPDPPTFLQNVPISQLAWGFTETLNAYRWTITINTVPETPYSENSPPTW